MRSSATRRLDVGVEALELVGDLGHRRSSGVTRPSRAGSRSIRTATAAGGVASSFLHDRCAPVSRKPEQGAAKMHEWSPGARPAKCQHSPYDDHVVTGWMGVVNPAVDEPQAAQKDRAAADRCCLPGHGRELASAARVPCRVGEPARSRLLPIRQDAGREGPRLAQQVEQPRQRSTAQNSPWTSRVRLQVSSSFIASLPPRRGRPPPACSATIPTRPDPASAC